MRAGGPCPCLVAAVVNRWYAALVGLAITTILSFNFGLFDVAAL